MLVLEYQAIFMFYVIIYRYISVFEEPRRRRAEATSGSRELDDEHGRRRTTDETGSPWIRAKFAELKTSSDASSKW